jgi:hypothetical protein
MITMPRSIGAPAAVRTPGGNAASTHDACDPGTLVDLVIAVGTDAPMLAVAQSLESALDVPVDGAEEYFPSSLRVTCLGVGSSFATTRFNTSVSDYLAVYVEDPSDLRETPLPPGDLARAVTDLSRYFDWLPGAHRAIFLTGDIGLETVSDRAAEIAGAIAAAKAANVKVYTCVSMPSPANAAAESEPMLKDGDIAQYLRLATQTLGAGYISADGAHDFRWMLRQVLCDIASDRKQEWNGGAPKRHGGNAGGRCAGSCGCCRCERSRWIVRSAGMLSMVLRRVADDCYPPS